MKIDGQVPGTPFNWSDDPFENILLGLARCENRPYIYDSYKHMHQNFEYVQLAEQGVKDGIFVLQEIEEGVGFVLTEKGLQLAQELRLIYDL